ncbi:MAG: hypothetical protein OXG44_00985, partial [Gammaproteobacteria bacterium]|nr:hypothetical protein [Gammaproteobacteria bacterium]
ETLDNWRLYRSHREAVADLICRPPQPASAKLCILGAGNCNDLDLARFTGRFSQVHLVDLDRQAMAKGVQRQSPPAPGSISLHGGVDLTGILKTLATWEPYRPEREIIAHCIREARAFAGLPFLGRFQVAASLCLLSQIIDSIVSVTGPKALPLELVEALRQRHLRLLAELLAPGGVGFLVTDFVLERGGPRPTRETSPEPQSSGAPDDSFLGVNPRELRASLSNDAVLGNQVRHASVSPSWLWRQNPRRTLRVCAISFQRIDVQAKPNPNPCLD